MFTVNIILILGAALAALAGISLLRIPSGKRQRPEEREQEIVRITQAVEPPQPPEPEEMQKTVQVTGEEATLEETLERTAAEDEVSAGGTPPEESARMQEEDGIPDLPIQMFDEPTY